MRELSPIESNHVSGGDFVDTSSSYHDIFWKSFAMASGVGAGYLFSVPVAAAMVIYGVAYYGIYTPASYVASAVYTVVTAPFVFVANATSSS